MRTQGSHCDGHSTVADALQDDAGQSLTCGLFDEAYLQDGHDIGVRKDLSTLSHAHSLPGLTNASEKSRMAFSPMGRSYSGALQASYVVLCIA